MQIPLTWLQLLVLTGSILVLQRAMMIRGWMPNEENLQDKVDSQDEVYWEVIRRREIIDITQCSLSWSHSSTAFLFPVGRPC